MKTFWKLIYNILFINLLYLLFMIGYLFNKKIRTGFNDRIKLVKKLKEKLKKLDKSKKNLWFHSASVGEFEQAKPIIEELRKKYNSNIIVTFFSPSGYHSAKKYQFADVVTYIPFDFIFYVKKFFAAINPSIAIIMRYDLWPNAIWELERKKVPIFLVDATMRKNSIRKLFGLKSFHKHLYSALTKILTISKSDLVEFRHFDIGNDRLFIVGDTRYDRVYYKGQTAKTTKILSQNIYQNKKVIIAGSTWQEDEEELLPCIIKMHSSYKDLLTIIVPHEPTIENIEQIESQLKDQVSSIRFSLLNQYNNEEVLIIDSVGILLNLYYYSHIAFVGGGFKSNIHNILEPAVYGVPVLFGPKHKSSQEAPKLIAAGGGFEVQNRNDIYKLLITFLDNEDYRLKCGELARQFVESNIGATEKTIKYLKPYL